MNHTFNSTASYSSFGSAPLTSTALGRRPFKASFAPVHLVSTPLTPSVKRPAFHVPIVFATASPSAASKLAPAAVAVKVKPTIQAVTSAPQRSVLHSVILAHSKLAPKVQMLSCAIRPTRMKNRRDELPVSEPAKVKRPPKPPLLKPALVSKLPPPPTFRPMKKTKVRATVKSIPVVVKRQAVKPVPVAKKVAAAKKAVVRVAAPAKAKAIKPKRPQPIAPAVVVKKPRVPKAFPAVIAVPSVVVIPQVVPTIRSSVPPSLSRFIKVAPKPTVAADTLKPKLVFVKPSSSVVVVPKPFAVKGFPAPERVAARVEPDTFNLHYALAPDDTLTLPSGIILTRIRATRDLTHQRPVCYTQHICRGDLGGYVQSYANLRDEAWVSTDAKVYGNAVVSGQAAINGHAEVFGAATVTDKAYVTDHAKVYGHATLTDEAAVTDDAQVYDNAQVKGEARVYESAQVYGNAILSSNNWISENARVYGDVNLTEGESVFGEDEVH